MTETPKRTIPTAVRRRVSAAFFDTEITPCAFAVLLILRNHPGRDHAVGIEYLRGIWATGGAKVWGARQVKLAVKELLERRGVPIGSARGSNPGYYLLCTPADVREAERPLAGEIRSLARRLRTINPRSAISRALCGQEGLGL